jgi:hypothetical protein
MAGRRASREPRGGGPRAGRDSLDPAAESTQLWVALKGDIM